MREIRNQLNLTTVQNDTSHIENIIALYKNEIDQLKSEIYFLREEMKQKNVIIKNVLNMKQVRIENCSSVNAIKLRQDIKNAAASSVFENIKENSSTDFDINVDTPKKKSLSDQKNENKDNINKLNDINIKISSNNNSPNKFKTNKDNLGINNNPLKIKSNKVISKVNTDSSHVSNINKINDNDNYCYNNKNKSNFKNNTKKNQFTLLEIAW